MKRILFALALTAFSTVSFAQGLRVMMKNGETINYPLSTVERVDFYDKELPTEGEYLYSIVKDDGSESITISYNNGEFAYAVGIDKYSDETLKYICEFNHDKTEYTVTCYRDGKLDEVDKFSNIKYNADGFITSYRLEYEDIAEKWFSNVEIKYNEDQRITEMTGTDNEDPWKHVRFAWSKGCLKKVGYYDELGNLKSSEELEYSDILNPNETYTYEELNPLEYLGDCAGGPGRSLLALLGKFGKGLKYLPSYRYSEYEQEAFTYKLNSAGNITEEMITTSYRNVKYKYNYTSNPNYKSEK